MIEDYDMRGAVMWIDPINGNTIFNHDELTDRKKLLKEVNKYVKNACKNTYWCVYPAVNETDFIVIECENSDTRNDLPNQLVTLQNILDTLNKKNFRITDNLNNDESTLIKFTIIPSMNVETIYYSSISGTPGQYNVATEKYNVNKRSVTLLPSPIVIPENVPAINAFYERGRRP
jgi:hypothetical protein